MSQLHPMELPGGYTVKTGSVIAYAKKVSRVMQGLHLGMTCTAYTQTGKSMALGYLSGQFEEQGSALVRTCTIPKYREKKVANNFFRRLRGDDAGDDSGVVHQYPMKALLNYCRTECEKLDTSIVVFGLDEAQNLILEELDALKDVAHQLSLHGIRPFVVMMGQPNLKFVRECCLEDDRADLVTRFMTPNHALSGLRFGDFQAFCDHIDTAVWPEGSGTTYTAHWAPTLWAAGWRMSNQVKPLWAAFEREAALMKLGGASLEVAGLYLAGALLELCRLLQRAPAKAHSHHTFDTAVRKSLFSEGVEVTDLGPAARKKFRVKWDRANARSR